MFVSVKKMVQAEQRAIKELLIPSQTLMFNAGKSVAELIMEKYGSSKRVGVVAGFGNNGGDGFVTAMFLADKGMNVKVVSLGKPDAFSSDAHHFLNACLQRKTINVKFAHDKETVAKELADFNHCELVVDGLLGTGLTGQVVEPIATAIRCLPKGCPVVAVDIPSGLNGTTGAVGDPCIRAKDTVTFARGKIGMMNREAYTGQITVTDIGIPDICFDDEKWYKLTHK